MSYEAIQGGLKDQKFRQFCYNFGFMNIIGLLSGLMK